MLRVERIFLFFFLGKSAVFLQLEVEIEITSKRLKIETLKLKFRWGTYGTTFVLILGEIGLVIQSFKPKT